MLLRMKLLPFGFPTFWLTLGAYVVSLSLPELYALTSSCAHFLRHWDASAPSYPASGDVYLSVSILLYGEQRLDQVIAAVLLGK